MLRGTGGGCGSPLRLLALGGLLRLIVRLLALRLLRSSVLRGTGGGCGSPLRLARPLLTALGVRGCRSGRLTLRLCCLGGCCLGGCCLLHVLHDGGQRVGGTALVPGDVRGEGERGGSLGHLACSLVGGRLRGRSGLRSLVVSVLGEQTHLLFGCLLLCSTHLVDETRDLVSERLVRVDHLLDGRAELLSEEVEVVPVVLLGHADLLLEKVSVVSV